MRMYLAFSGLVLIGMAVWFRRRMILIITGEFPDVDGAMPVEQQAVVRRRLAVFVALMVLVGIALLVAAATTS